jgi:hypothetical protein
MSSITLRQVEFDFLAGRCVILSCNGQRTMRTCLEGAERLSASDICIEDFRAKWVFLSGYILYRHAPSIQAGHLAFL